MDRQCDVRPLTIEADSSAHFLRQREDVGEGRREGFGTSDARVWKSTRDLPRSAQDLGSTQLSDNVAESLLQVSQVQ